MLTRRPALQSAWLLMVVVFLIRLNVPSEASDFSMQPGYITRTGYITRNWDTEEGLPSGNVSAVAKTRDGLLWVGSSSGLVRYDGFQFNSFFPGNASALAGARASALFMDRRGDLWIGKFGGGLSRFSGSEVVPISLDVDAQRATSWSFAEDANGTVWGALEYGGVFAFPKGGTLVYGTNSGLSTMVWNITVDREGQVWVISRWRLVRFDGKQWRVAEGLRDDFPKVAAITAAHDGGLWVATVGATSPPTGDRGARIFKYRNGRVIEDSAPFPWNQDSRRSIPRVLLEDNQGRLWMTTRGAGIFFRDGKKWQLFNDSPVQATCMFEDEGSTLWIGTDGAGLYQVRPRTVTAVEPAAGIPPTCFWTVFPSRDGNVWGGTDGNGIVCWKNGLLTRFGAEQGVRNEHVNAVIEDHDRNVWAGTMDGLFVLRGGRFEPVNGVNILRLPVYAMKEDHSGAIWVGTRNGLVQIGATSTNVFGQEQGIPYGPINAIEEDRAGRLWVSIPPYRDNMAPAYGLFAQSGKRFEHITEGKWSGGPNIRSLHADAAGNLWIGTIGTGFFRLRDGKFTEYSQADGVPHSRIQAVVSDDIGNLWCCSEQGVFGCPIAQLENYTRGLSARLNFWRVERSAGLPNKATTGNGQPCAMRGSDGRIWFANGNAIAAFDPRLVIKAAYLQPPIIQQVLVNGIPQALAADGRLRVSSQMRSVEFHYTSPNTAAPELPNFWIRLKGFDRDWMPGSVTRAAVYNLRPGNYEFSVAVTSPDGSRIETDRPLRVEVVPQFWERQSVQIMAGVLLVAATALGVWRWERARLQRRMRELEFQGLMNQVRECIARDIHDDLGSGLTEITLLSDNLLVNDNDSRSLAKTVERIGARARSLTHEMDEVVWAINPRTDTLESLVTYLNDFAQERLALAGIRCRLNTAVELPRFDLPSDIRHSLFRAAKEALNNAIKHAAATEVVVTIEPCGDNILFIIQDNGRGFDLQQTLKRGNGLKIMRQRLGEVGGRCEIQSAPGLGTSVRLMITTVNHSASRLRKIEDPVAR